MDEFNIHIDVNGGNENKKHGKSKPSFISPNMEELMQNKPKKTTKKVNTKVPKEVLTIFLMYCIAEERFRKDVYSDMMQQFIEDNSDQPITLSDSIQGVPINFMEMEEANFEFDYECFPTVEKLKVMSRFTYIDIYTQVIVQFMNKHTAQVHK